MKIAIIGGAGHIGLPLSLVLAKRNNIVIVDPSENVLKIKKKIAPFEDKGIEKYLKNKNIHKNISYSNDINLLKPNFVDAIIIAIGTPLDEWGNPVTADLEKICLKSVNKLKKNGIIILRSTVTPGFSKKIFNNIKKNKKKINIAYCPERIAQGKSFTELFKFAQIVGIEKNNKSTFVKVKKIFNKISPKFFLTDTTTAELVKLFANFWRYSTFAISNQIYMTANQFGCSANEIINLIRYKYPRSHGIQSPGFAAGPCLYKDTQQLVASLNNNFIMGSAAISINEGIAYTVSDMAINLSKKKDILILGASFKPNCDDHRSSLSFKLYKILSLRKKENVYLHDPYVKHPKVINNLKNINIKNSFVIVASPHDIYDKIFKKFKNKKNIINIWND